MPVQDDHFLLHDAPDIEEFYHKQGISEVRELDVLLPFPDIDRNFPSWYQVWAGGVLVCQGDGEFVEYASPFTVKTNQKGRTGVYNAPGDTLITNGVARVPFDWGGAHFGEGEHIPCPGEAKGKYPHCAACKLSGILKVMMADPDLFRFGYYQITTGSGRNYDTIMGTLELVPAGQLNGFPFKLRLVPGQTSYVGQDGQRHATTRYFLELEPDPEIIRGLYRRQTARMLGAPSKNDALLLEGPDYGDLIDVEPEAPPPYAEAQVQADYEEAVGITDEVLIDGEPQVISKAPYIEPPEDLARDNIVDNAKRHLPFDNVGQIMGAMLAAYGPQWSREPKWDLQDAWTMLQKHAQAGE